MPGTGHRAEAEATNKDSASCSCRLLHHLGSPVGLIHMVGGVPTRRAVEGVAARQGSTLR